MRVFGYIRVSKERDDMISPEIQRDEIERYCTQKGWDVTEWFEDLDFTGRVGREKRPAPCPHSASPRAKSRREEGRAKLAKDGRWPTSCTRPCSWSVRRPHVSGRGGGAPSPAPAFLTGRSRARILAVEQYS
jgi:hypothetical protein